ncbi:hypothetical protein HDIA_1747 [Hartmannibacter diazotrophicus]|uniref:DUF3306 domain-containing protein n=1 Tax=Hartmannibacter diazotrophicus TaxID=1482074 RepID=A0A2C9D569_9HYPH|nr:DUF3306 domain-containing protein [Hartmannibacter diazotrophicus]SON55288.1 hypothetical protein HDIA_1747 [Hartmannibacter diazotrophicus]
MAERKPPVDDGGENFLTRWSRRKQAIASGGVPDDPTEVAAERNDVIEAGAAPEDQAPDLELEENRKAAEAIDLDSLTFGDDFKIFMKRGVPDTLRKAALRKLWRSNPVLANIDGLNDYDDDFNNPVHRVYSSIWEAGRGFLSEAEQAAQKATGRLTQAPEQGQPDMAEGAPDETTIAEVGEQDGAAAAPPQIEATTTPQMEAYPADAAAEVQGAGMDGDESPPPVDEPTEAPRRVSIRQRLQG